LCVLCASGTEKRTRGFVKKKLCDSFETTFFQLGEQECEQEHYVHAKCAVGKNQSDSRKTGKSDGKECDFGRCVVFVCFFFFSLFLMVF
jgi:hypothetical protein